MFVSTIGDDGSRQSRSVAAILAAVLRFRIHKSLLVDFFFHINPPYFSLLSFFFKFWIYIRKPYVFSPLLATTGAASIPHMRRFSLQFCDFLYQNEELLKIFHINPRCFRFLTKMQNTMHLFLFFFITKMKNKIHHPHDYDDYTHRIFPTIGDDGIRQVPSDAAILAAVFWKVVLILVMVETFSHKSSILFVPMYFLYCFEFT